MSRFYLKGTNMRKNTSILRYKQTPGNPHKPPSHAPLANPIGGSGNNRESPDLDLEETPLTSAVINILVPPGDPVFTQGTSMACRGEDVTKS
jgi:hypothetical protein